MLVYSFCTVGDTVPIVPFCPFSRLGCCSLPEKPSFECVGERGYGRLDKKSAVADTFADRGVGMICPNHGAVCSQCLDERDAKPLAHRGNGEQLRSTYDIEQETIEITDRTSDSITDQLCAHIVERTEQAHQERRVRDVEADEIKDRLTALGYRDSETMKRLSVSGNPVADSKQE